MSRSEKNKKRKKKIYRYYAKLSLLVALSLVLIGSFVFGITYLNNKDKNVASNKQEVLNETSIIKNTPKELNLIAAGDVMAHQPQLNAQYDSSTGKYSFDNNFALVKKYVERTDLSVANLETTLAGKELGYDSYPTFNTPDDLAVALKNSGFNLLSTINNHTLDKGDTGVSRTLRVLDSLHLDSVGTYDENLGNNYIIKSINDINLGITAYSYGEIKNNTTYLNGIMASANSKDKLNVFDMTDVNKAFNTIMTSVNKIKDTDMQIVILHWGNEYQRTPSKFQTTLAQKLCDAGVDIIIGSHPHVVQPVEMITSTDKSNETLVIYSLGNFISNQRREYTGYSYTEDGLLVDITLSKKQDDKEATITNVTCIPTWVNKYTASKVTYEIIPMGSKSDLTNLEHVSLDTLKTSFKNTTSLIKTSDIIKIPQNVFN